MFRVHVVHFHDSELKISIILAAKIQSTLLGAKPNYNDGVVGQVVMII